MNKCKSKEDLLKELKESISNSEKTDEEFKIDDIIKGRANILYKNSLKNFIQFLLNEHERRKEFERAKKHYL